MRPPSSAVALLHLRRLDRFLKRQVLHSSAYTLERDLLAYFDAAHLQKLVKNGQWDAAWCYVRPFSPLWEAPEGEGTSQHYTDFLRGLQHNSMLDYLACRGEEGGRAARSLFWSNDDTFRNKFPETAKRHDLSRSMASERARASVNWDAIKLTTLEKLQELLHSRPDLERSFRMRKPQRTPTALEITPLGLRSSRRHQRKRVDKKPARVSSATLLQPNEASRAFYISSSSANKGRKRLISQDDYCTENARHPYPTECFKRPQTAGDAGESGEIST